MNRTYLQLVAILMGTSATTFVAAEWRWEPAHAGNYLVIVGPVASAAADGMAAGTTQHKHGAVRSRLSNNNQ